MDIFCNLILNKWVLHNLLKIFEFSFSFGGCSIFIAEFYNMEKKTLIYCYDAYCGWCYGFSPVIQKISEEMSNKIDLEVKKLIDDAYKLATEILKKNRKLLDKVAEKLLEVETLEGDQFEEIMGHAKVSIN